MGLIHIGAPRIQHARKIAFNHTNNLSQQSTTQASQHSTKPASNLANKPTFNHARKLVFSSSSTLLKITLEGPSPLEHSLLCDTRVLTGANTFPSQVLRNRVLAQSQQSLINYGKGFISTWALTGAFTSFLVGRCLCCNRQISRQTRILLHQREF